LLEAIAVGALAQISLLASGLFASWFVVPRRVVGWLAGFGAGALISAISFDLLVEALPLNGAALMLWLLIGAGVFVGADYIVDHRFPSDGTSQAAGIVLGSVVDGIPESLIFGISLAAGTPVSGSFLWAVMVSNVPQALAPSADFVAAGWSRSRLVLMWGAVIVACGLAAGVGYLLGSLGLATGDRMAALAAGGLLAMLTDSLMPFAFEHGGDGAGIGTVVGFALAAATSTSS